MQNGTLFDKSVEMYISLSNFSVMLLNIFSSAM